MNVDDLQGTITTIIATAESAADNHLIRNINNNNNNNNNCNQSKQHQHQSSGTNVKVAPFKDDQLLNQNSNDNDRGENLVLDGTTSSSSSADGGESAVPPRTRRTAVVAREPMEAYDNVEPTTQDMERAHEPDRIEQGRQGEDVLTDMRPMTSDSGINIPHRRVSFPKHDKELVTGYSEAADPWANGNFRTIPCLLFIMVEYILFICVYIRVALFKAVVRVFCFFCRFYTVIV